MVWWSLVGVAVLGSSIAGACLLRPHLHRAIPESVEEMLGWPDADLNFGLAALVLSKRFFPETDIAASQARVADYANSVRAILSGRSDHDVPNTRIGAINTVLYLREGFAYDHADELGQRPENRMLGPLLSLKTGTCANLFQLYFAVAEDLGFPIDVVQATYHAFVRYELPDGTHQNIEPTSGGGSSSDDEIVANLEIPETSVQSGWMMRPLSKREAIGLLLQEEAIAEIRRGNWNEGHRLSTKLVDILPRDGSNWFNLALTEAHLAKTARALGGAVSSVQARRLTDAALAHAQKAKDFGITPQLGPDYVERQREIARWRKIDPERAKRESERDAAWDPVAVIDAVASGALSSSDPDESLPLGLVADSMNAINAASEMPLDQQGDLVNRANLTGGVEQQRLLMQLSGVPSAGLDPIPNPSTWSSIRLEGP